MTNVQEVYWNTYQNFKIINNKLLSYLKKSKNMTNFCKTPILIFDSLVNYNNSNFISRINPGKNPKQMFQKKLLLLPFRKKICGLSLNIVSIKEQQQYKNVFRTVNFHENSELKKYKADFFYHLFPFFRHSHFHSKN